MADIEETLKQFHSDLDRAEHLLRLIKAFRNFAASDVPQAIVKQDVAWPEALDLTSAAPRVRTDLPMLSGSLLLYVCGRFEYFVRELVVAIADALSAKATCYTDLPERVREGLYSGTLEVAQAPERYGYDKVRAQALIVGLANNLQPGPAPSDPDSSGGETNLTEREPGAASVVIQSELLSLTDSNMNSRTLAEVFKRVDITEIWQEIAKQAPLKTHLTTPTDSTCRAEAVGRLDKVMKERNGIAHPTSTTTFPDPDQVLEICDFFRVLSRVLIDVVQVPRQS